MTISTLPTAPHRDQGSTAYVINANNMMAALPTLVSEINTTTASISGMASGTASAIPYTFSTTTTDADPGSGFIRLNNATQDSATAAFLDLNGSNSVDFTTFIDSINNVTGSFKGYLRITKISDTSKFILFKITAWTSASGYRKLTLVKLSSSSSNPFANNDSVIAAFTSGGIGGWIQYSDSGVVTSAATYDVSIPTTASGANCIAYTLVIQDLQAATNATTLQMRCIYGGTPDTGANYYGHLNASAHNSTSYVGIATSGGTSLQITGAVSNSSGRGYNGRINIDAPTLTTSVAKIFSGVGGLDIPSGGSGTTTANFIGGNTTIGSTLTGLRFFMSSGNIASARFILYALV